MSCQKRRRIRRVPDRSVGVGSLRDAGGESPGFEAESVIPVTGARLVVFRVRITATSRSPAVVAAGGDAESVALPEVLCAPNDWATPSALAKAGRPRGSIPASTTAPTTRKIEVAAALRVSRRPRLGRDSRRGSGGPGLIHVVSRCQPSTSRPCAPMCSTGCQRSVIRDRPQAARQRTRPAAKVRPRRPLLRPLPSRSLLESADLMTHGHPKGLDRPTFGLRAIHRFFSEHSVRARRPTGTSHQCPGSR